MRLIITIISITFSNVENFNLKQAYFYTFNFHSLYNIFRLIKATYNPFLADKLYLKLYN